MTVRWTTAATAGGAVLVAVGLGACPKPPVAPPAGCGKDADCRLGRVCIERRCADAAGLRPAADAGPTEADAREKWTAGPLPFAMYLGNAQHTGRTAGAAPAKRPAEQWSYKVSKPIVGSPTVGPDGTIYFTSHDGKLRALDAAGALLWEMPTGDRVWSTPAVAEDGTVYTGSDDDHLYAVDGKTGKVVWKLRVGACDPPVGGGPEGVRCDVDGGPTLGPDGTIYTGGDGVYAVWPDGVLRWKFATPEHVSTAPAIALDGTIYAGCQDDALYAIRPDGTKKWEFRTSRDIESSPTVGPDGRVYFGGDDDNIYALDADGNVVWKVVTRDDVRGSPAIDDDGVVYAGSYDGHLYAIAPDGTVKWKFASADKIHASPAIATDGTILVGSQDDHLYAIGPDGALRWYLQFDSDVDTTPSISRSGVLYAASDDRTLRAFK
jgi:outer membrane protein assembly factor BamB